MTRHEECRELPYTPEQVFAVVADIASYPEFLPWCQAARIRGREQEGDIEVVTADLIIAFLAFREKFTSRVSMDQAQNRIDVEYVDGPMRSLENHWKFSPSDTGCRVDFCVEFEFKSRILEKAIGRVFDHAMQKMVNAFEERAAALYPTPN